MLSRFMIVYFMRHGQTEYNVKNLINCTPSEIIPLTKKGREQVENVRKKLAGAKFDVIFVSEFLRTQETANILNRSNVPIKIDKRLNEFNSGLEGQNIQMFVDERKKSGKSRMDFKLDDTRENLGDVKKRVKDFLDDLKDETYQDVLVITHEAVILAAMAILEKNVKESDVFERRLENLYFCPFEI